MVMGSSGWFSKDEGDGGAGWKCGWFKRWRKNCFLARVDKIKGSSWGFSQSKRGGVLGSFSREDERKPGGRQRI
jgi:hypothetical protein